MVGRCWASCLTRNLRWILFLLGNPTSPSGIGFNHHRRFCLGFVEPNMDSCGIFEFICTLWLGGVGLRASPATYVGSCFYWEVRQAHRALKLTTIAVVRWVCGTPYGFVRCFRVHLLILVGRCWASCLTHNLRLAIFYMLMNAWVLPIYGLFYIAMFYGVVVYVVYMRLVVVIISY